MHNRTYIIAEAGVNHNGDINMALQLIDEAKKAGADCVKFQTFKAEQIVTKTSPKANYQLKVTDAEESQFTMLQKLELGFDHYKQLIGRCKAVGIDFLSTPYNKSDVDFLQELDIPGFKIASGQLTEVPFLRYVAQAQKPIILSTGMATMADVFTAVETIRATGNNDLVVLQCTTNYPSSIDDANILAMNSIKKACNVRVGYSDHVENNQACYAAVALGAEIIEKHFTLDRSLPGPDHSSSLDPEGFAELVKGIREIERALGTGLKVPTSTEQQNSHGMKRSLVALQDLKAGTVITEEVLGFKRPANGLPINQLDLIIGKQLARDVVKDEALQYHSIVW